MIARPASRLAFAHASALILALALAGCRGQSEKAEAVVAKVEPARVESPGQVAAVAVAKARAECCKDDAPAAAEALTPARPIDIPDVTVLDQDGKAVRFYEDLVKGKVVAINFVFTSCRTACPLLGAGFMGLQEKLGDQLGKDYGLISVSVDPDVDRPERLRSWARQYGARPGWVQVTATEGGRADLIRLLKALQVYSPEKTNHSQSVLVVDGDSREGWTSRRTASVAELATMLDQALKTRGGRNYFTDTPLIDQDGRSFRFYSDLVRGKVVVINPFFSSCTGSCLTMASILTKLQERLGDRLGKDVVILSLTVDPDVDTRERLALYAKQVGARTGWHFLTGTKADLETVERRLGQFVAVRESHPTTMFVGNDATGLWVKHLDPRDSAGLILKVEEALKDVRVADGATP